MPRHEWHEATLSETLGKCCAITAVRRGVERTGVRGEGRGGVVRLDWWGWAELDLHGVGLAGLG